MGRQDCEKYSDDLKAFFDHELSPLRRWVVGRHISGCADCQKELKEMSQVTEEVVSKTKDALHELNKQQLAASMASAVKPRRASARDPRELVGALAGVAAVAVIFMIFFPVFAKVREKARQVSSGPPRGMPVGLAATQYAQDYNEKFPAQAAPLRNDKVAEISGTDNSVQLANPTVGVSNFSTNASAQGGPVMGASVSSAPTVQYYNSSGSPTVTLASPPSDPAADLDAGRQIHKSATITVQVPDPEAIGDKIEDMARTSGGFVTTSDLTTSNDGTKSYAMTVKVPLPQFEATLSQIGKLGSVQDKEVTGEDITEKISDADSREQVLEDDMAQALDQLKKKGSHASWDLQQDARDLRIQLAQARARLVLLRHLAELSEIDVTLTQPDKPMAPVQTGFMADLSNSAHDALQAMSTAVITLIGVLLWIVAYSPLWIPALLVGRLFWKRYYGPLPKSEATSSDQTA
jgi:hypothetical protein